MLELGKRQSLTVVKTVDFGVYLSEEEGAGEEVLLPKKEDSGGNEDQAINWKSSYIKIQRTVSSPPERSRLSSWARLPF